MNQQTKQTQQAQETLQPHQQRVVEEKAELDNKLAILEDFFSDPIFNNLTKKEHVRLHWQAAYMTSYRDILAERIAAFGEDE